MTPPLAFVHIGLPKCASTYLQHVWHRDVEYQWVKLDTLMQAARSQAIGDAVIPAPVQIDEALATTAIGSSEGFSWAFCNRPASQRYLWDLHRRSAALLSASRLTSRVLLLIRSPHTFLRSLHEQSIKEGGFSTFAQFFAEQRTLAEGTLDIQSILDAYRPYFKEVVVLCTDELRTNPDAFWAKYENLLDAPKPEHGIEYVAADDFVVNSSISEKVYDLALLNRHSQHLVACIDQLDEYRSRLSQDYETHRHPFAGSSWWVNRRIVEFASAEQLRQLTGSFRENPDERASFSDVRIDQAFVSFLDQQFFRPISQLESIEPTWIQQAQSKSEALASLEPAPAT